MTRRNKIKRIAFIRRQATLLANIAAYHEVGRMTESELLEDLRAIARGLLREIERKEKDGNGG